MHDHIWFKTARNRLGLSGAQLARILGLPDARRVRSWEQDPATTTAARSPNPTACRVLEWMLEGFDPGKYGGSGVTGAKRQTSSAVSSLASRVLQGYMPTEAEARTMAASLLAQDEVAG